MEKFQEVAELVDFAIDLQLGITKILDDGKVDFKDAAVLPGLVWSGKKGLLGLKGITVADVRSFMPQLIDYFKSKFDLLDHELELLIEDSVAALFNVFSVGERWNAYFKNRASA